MQNLVKKGIAAEQKAAWKMRDDKRNVTLAAAHGIHVPVSHDRMDFSTQLGMDCGEDTVSSVGARADQTVLHTRLGLVKLSP